MYIFRVNKMNIKLLKSALRFWQEIAFIVVFGILVIGITMNISASFQFGINIVFYGIFVSILVILIGQFFWKNLILAMILAPILAFGSVWGIMAALSDFGKIPAGDTKTFVGYSLITLFCIGLTIAAITMPKKYLKQ